MKTTETKETYVSAANEALPGTLIAAVDVTEMISTVLETIISYPVTNLLLELGMAWSQRLLKKLDRFKS